MQVGLGIAAGGQHLLRGGVERASQQLGRKQPHPLGQQWLVGIETGGVGGAAGEAAKDQQLVGLLERTGRIEGTAQAQHPIRPLTADRLQPSNQSVGGQGHQNSPATRPCLGSRTNSHCSSPTP